MINNDGSIILKWSNEFEATEIYNKLKEVVDMRTTDWVYSKKSMRIFYVSWDNTIELTQKSKGAIVKSIDLSVVYKKPNTPVSEEEKTNNRNAWYDFIERDYKDYIRITLSSDGKIRLKHKSKEDCDTLYEILKKEPIPEKSLRGEYVVWNIWVSMKWSNKKTIYRIKVIY